MDNEQYDSHTNPCTVYFHFHFICLGNKHTHKKKQINKQTHD